MNPPPGCPFQTRCRWKKFVPDNKCETELPPFKDLGRGHRSLCWLSDDVLDTMEPVISFERGATAATPSDPVPADEPHGEGPGTGPGFAGPPPIRPHGKTGDAEADIETAEIERDGPPVHGSRAMTGAPGDSSPDKLQTEVGDGRQAVSGEVTPALGSTRQSQVESGGQKPDRG